MYKVIDIIRGTTVDGPGFRTSIYFSGCIHECPGCHNPQSWNPNFGRNMSLMDIMEVVEEEDFDVTLTGGDPLYHPLLLKKLVDSLKANKRNVWIYTGFTWEEILKNKDLKNAIESADVLVDGRYDKTLRDPDLPFRGSRNQRIIDIRLSLETGRIYTCNY